MSDDEEVVNKGNELYKHLLNLGYTEFETFDFDERPSFFQEAPISCTDLSSNQISKNTYLPKPSPGSSVSISLSYNVNQLVSCILNSKLLFGEDIDPLESLLLNSSIYNHRPKSKNMLIGTFSLNVLSWAIFLKIGRPTYICLPVCLTGLCSLFSFWYFRKLYMEMGERNLLCSHVDSLQKLCISIQKTFRLLKETEILSTGQVLIHNVNAAMYVQPVKHRKDLMELSSWKTLPHLRKCMVDTLNEVAAILLLSCESLIQLLPPWINITPRFTKNASNFQEKLASLDDLNHSNIHISIESLQSLIEYYLDIQSEYLKITACCLFPQNIFPIYSMAFINCSTPNYSSLHRNTVEIIKVLSTTQSKILVVLFKLKLEQDIQNKFGRKTPSVDCDSFPAKAYWDEVNHCQVELHNIFLLIELMLVKIRSLEDDFENITRIKEKNVKSNLNLKESITTQLSSVRNDFQSTMKAFDHMYNQFSLKTVPETNLSPNINCKDDISKKSEPISTGILVGLSDFRINHPDEVFLATSGSNTESVEHIMDEFFLPEKMAKMPKMLISELSITLKSIRKDFRARERLALERSGLNGDENLLSDDENESDENSLRGEEICALRDENNFDMIEENLKVKLLEQNHDEHDSIESELSESQGFNYVEVPIQSGDTSSIPHMFTDSSLANLVAMKSKLWGNQSEECFTNE